MAHHHPGYRDDDSLADNVENGTELNFDDFSLYVSVVKE